jgi:hypothetical protein
MTPYKRGGTATMILRAVCNERKNSDLRADDADILRAFNEHFAELEEQHEEVRKTALKLAEYALAAKTKNTPEYMDGLATKINMVARALRESERARFDPKSGGFVMCAGLRVKFKNESAS